MKRIILLFSMAVFIIMVTSCVVGTSVPSAAQDTDRISPQPQRVFIIPKSPNYQGKKPEVVPRCVGLRYGKKYNEQVEWITPSGVEFTIRFENGNSPFEKAEFTNESNTSESVLSGPVMVDPEERDDVYKYTLEVTGYGKIDPVIIVFR